ncbi:AAA-like domain-containing protein [Streptomyces halobius]|uniref:AAA-like domain-containing protein n=1 Tax=Streptomyces halobius TaxID=2879846 RepID=A0ABY4M2H0_9ACTN|nr:AAA-like domain-containing protein [Streptomyces halobius]UQA91393.1 AAA-like domain-containing protein [Streptomyces halobius]
MTIPSRPCSPALDEVNAEIRRLMEEPVCARRTEEYFRLLSLWTEAARSSTPWTKAA